MPRPNRARSMASESNLAARIAYERSRRGLSYEALAKLMTDAGCAIQGSAIYRIEKGDPPRRVAVDELVALADVFGVDDLSELLHPVEFIEQRRAQEIAEELHRVLAGVNQAVKEALRLYLEYAHIAARSKELTQYINNHAEAKERVLPEVSLRADDIGWGVTDEALEPVSVAKTNLLNTMLKVAYDNAESDGPTDG